jgi:hypothetical protein
MSRSDRQDDRTEQQVSAIDTLRTTLASGFAFVRSREVTASVAAVPYEESVDAAIKAIQEDASEIRPGKLTAVRSLVESLVAAVDRARELPPDVFTSRPGQGSSNTTIGGDGPSGDEVGDG